MTQMRTPAPPQPPTPMPIGMLLFDNLLEIYCSPMETQITAAANQISLNKFVSSMVQLGAFSGGPILENIILCLTELSNLNII